jgi:dTDP-4-dehydrorhamnose reductase
VARMKILIIGAGGRLGAALAREYRDRFEIKGLTHSQIDIGDFDRVEQMLSPIRADVVINCAAMTNVDLCEEKREEAFRINATGPELLAQICEAKGARFIHFSTDYVFDGKKNSPYDEEDEAEPLSVYGESKREGEENVLAVNERHLVVRVSWVFGPDRPSFIDNIIRRAQDNPTVDAVADKFSTPTYTRDVAATLPRFFAPEVGGILHFANEGECSWQQYGQHALDICAELGIPLNATTVAPARLSDMQNFVARRPVYTVLSTARYAEIIGQKPRSWRDAVAEYVKDCYSQK